MADLTTELVTDRGGMAVIVGCSINHINKLVAKGMPRRARGQYAIPDCVQWLLADAVTRGGRDPEQVEEVVEARTELYREQTRRARVERQRAERELLPAEDVRAAMMQLVAVLVTGLEGLPFRAASELLQVSSESQAAHILGELCHAIRSDIADTLADVERDTLGSGATVATAADPGSGTMGRRGATTAAT